MRGDTKACQAVSGQLYPHKMANAGHFPSIVQLTYNVVVAEIGIANPSDCQQWWVLGCSAKPPLLQRLGTNMKSLTPYVLWSSHLS